MNTAQPKIAVIGAGSFGTAIANLLAENQPVYLYIRRKEIFEAIRDNRISNTQALHPNVVPINHLQETIDHCHALFPMVPSNSFRALLKVMAPFLRPSQIMIHGIKGLDIYPKRLTGLEDLDREHIHTMSQVIKEETVIIKCGCISGPNLSKELAQGEPAGAVIASKFEEVVNEGLKAFRSDRFQVVGSDDLRGIELAGVLKNPIAIASGIIAGLGYGHNTQAMLITKGLAELINIGKVLDSKVDSFLGLAGIGDLIATCTGSSSRNYRVGYGLAKKRKLEDILEELGEVAEGVNTVQIVRALMRHHGLNVPIFNTLHDILFEGKEIEQAVKELMRFNVKEDVNFL